MKADMHCTDLESTDLESADLESADRKSSGNDDERGATMVLFAFVLVIIMLASAMAVDLSSMARRGQELQNLADAAALSAVTTLVDSGDPADAIQAGNAVLAMFGTSRPSDLNLAYTFTNGVEAQVTITDNNPERYFAVFAPGESDIIRTATAVLDTCAKTCAEQDVQISAPFTSVEANGSGDGFSPVSVQNRFYALNHNQSDLVCVDRAPEPLDPLDPPGPPAPCWTAQDPFTDDNDDGDINTDSIFYAAVVGNKIWYGGQSSTDYSLYCWQVADDPGNDARCGSPSLLANLPAATFAGKHYRTRGGGLAQVGNEIFVFTDDHNVHCVNGVTGTPCADYASPKPNGLTGVVPAMDGINVSGAGMDRLVHDGVDDGRIYVSLHVMPGSEADGYDPGVWVHCWHAIDDDPCLASGFVPYKVHDEGQPRHKGRLFFFRSTLGTIAGVCSTDFGEITCIDEDTGAFDASQTATMAQLAATMPQSPDDTVGVHTYHAPSKRVFLPSSHSYNQVACWDFGLNQSCPTSSLSVLGKQVEAYGFVYEGDCLYGLGHEAVFFTMNPDGQAGCTTGIVKERIDACECADGSRYWGKVEINGLLSISGPFERFDVSVIEKDNGPVLLPPISMIDHPTGEIPLTAIPTDIEYVSLLIEVVAKPGETPWADGLIPEITVTWVDLPVLTE